jgi:hypothetical protein
VDQPPAACTARTIAYVREASWRFGELSNGYMSVEAAVEDQWLGSLDTHADQEWTAPVGSVSGEDVLEDVVRVSSDSLGARLLAAYALGSLAHGGFSPAVSDVDVALILTDPIQESDTQSLVGVADAVRSIGSPLHTRVSLFWGTPESLIGHAAGGRFPALDRLCLFEHGRLLMGNDVRAGLPAPDKTELLVAGAQFALDFLAEDVVARARQPDQLAAAGVRWTTKIVLFPVRFLLTADTGREGTNDAAVQHYSDLNRAPGVALVRAALEWRTKPPSAKQALAMLRDDFVPLYDYYVADHIHRLRSVGQSELARAFSDWRSQLLAAKSDTAIEA